MCLAGATGWAGSGLASGIQDADDMELVGAVSRSRAGHSLGEALDITGLGLTVSGSVEKALETPCDVFVEYTKPAVAKGHILQALEAGANVVVGISGLTDEDYTEIAGIAQSAGRGGPGGGQFCTYGGAAAEICRNGGRPHTPLGNHRLCQFE